MNSCGNTLQEIEYLNKVNQINKHFLNMKKLVKMSSIVQKIGKETQCNDQINIIGNILNQQKMVRSKKKIGLVSEDSQSIRVQSRSRIQIRQKTRGERIRDKNIVYPQSSQDKIVFITNKYGNGFRKEELDDYNIPSHIEVQKMYNQINRVCYRQWKNFHDELEKKQLSQLEIAVYAGLILAILLFIIYLSVINHQKTEAFTPCNYLIVSLIFAILLKAIIVSFAQRQEVHPDQGMVSAIHSKLMELNHQEQKYYPEKTRFQWTCHSQCLWIAISF